MSKQDKDVDANKHRREVKEQSDAQRGGGSPKVESRAWATLNKLPGASQRIAARRKVPHGTLGGSGRKTNLSRSS